jgi:hypothetical protein
MRIDVTRFVNWCIKPQSVVILTVLMSFAAWLFPGFQIFRKGFIARESLLSSGAVIVALWYAGIIGAAVAGFRLGKKVRTPHENLDRNIGLESSSAYLALTAVGALGFSCLILYLASQVGLSGIKTFILEGQGNQLKEALYEDYSIGPLSLRYIVILSGGVAIFRIISGISRSFIDVFNLGELLLTALVSSRLSLIVALFIGFGLFATYQQPVRVNLGKVALLFGGIFVLLAVYNAARNVNYYQARGNDNFLVAGFSEILAYTGAPFQGALTTGDYFNEISSGKEVTTYSGIEIELTTNSAFAELTEDIGGWSFAVAIVTSFLAAWVMGLLTSHLQNYFALAYFVLLYCFSEFWRIFMFYRGIVITLMVFAVCVPYALAMIPRKESPRWA